MKCGREGSLSLLMTIMPYHFFRGGPRRAFQPDNTMPPARPTTQGSQINGPAVPSSQVLDHDKVTRRYHTRQRSLPEQIYGSGGQGTRVGTAPSTARRVTYTGMYQQRQRNAVRHSSVPRSSSMNILLTTSSSSPPPSSSRTKFEDRGNNRSLTPSTQQKRHTKSLAMYGGSTKTASRCALQRSVS